MDSHEVKKFTQSLRGTLAEMTQSYEIVVMAGFELAPEHSEYINEILFDTLKAQAEGRIVVGYSCEDWSGMSADQVRAIVAGAVETVIETDSDQSFVKDWLLLPTSYEYEAEQEGHYKKQRPSHAWTQSRVTKPQSPKDQWETATTQ